MRLSTGSKPDSAVIGIIHWRLVVSVRGSQQQHKYTHTHSATMSSPPSPQFMNDDDATPPAEHRTRISVMRWRAEQERRRAARTLALEVMQAAALCRSPLLRHKDTFYAIIVFLAVKERMSVARLNRECRRRCLESNAPCWDIHLSFDALELPAGLVQSPLAQRHVTQVAWFVEEAGNSNDRDNDLNHRHLTALRPLRNLRSLDVTLGFFTSWRGLQSSPFPNTLRSLSVSFRIFANPQFAGNDLNQERRVRNLVARINAESLPRLEVLTLEFLNIADVDILLSLSRQFLRLREIHLKEFDVLPARDVDRLAAVQVLSEVAHVRSFLLEEDADDSLPLPSDAWATLLQPGRPFSRDLKHLSAIFDYNNPLIAPCIAAMTNLEHLNCKLSGDEHCGVVRQSRHIQKFSTFGQSSFERIVGALPVSLVSLELHEVDILTADDIAHLVAACPAMRAVTLVGGYFAPSESIVQEQAQRLVPDFKVSRRSVNHPFAD
jgi:hypothetical protein